MCRLKIKIKLAGSKRHKFKKIISLPRNLPINGYFHKKLGFWDTRKNYKIRYVVINLYDILYQYKINGLTPNKKVLYLLYYFFASISIKNHYNYKLILENEIRKKYNSKKFKIF